MIITKCEISVYVSLQKSESEKKMESAAELFSLSLGSEEPLVAKPEASAVCLVTSASLKFATDIREKIRFASKVEIIGKKILSKAKVFFLDTNNKKMRSMREIYPPLVTIICTI